MKKIFKLSNIYFSILIPVVKRLEIDSMKFLVSHFEKSDTGFLGPMEILEQFTDRLPKPSF